MTTNIYSCHNFSTYLLLDYSAILELDIDISRRWLAIIIITARKLTADVTP